MLKISKTLKNVKGAARRQSIFGAPIVAKKSPSLVASKSFNLENDTSSLNGGDNLNTSMLDPYSIDGLRYGTHDHLTG